MLIRPAASNVLPNEVDVASRVTRSISLHIPVLSSAMDTVTEAKLAIAMAQAGGIGVIHRNLDPAAQAAQVAQVKKFESGMVVNPVTIHPAGQPRRRAEADGRLSDLRHPVVEPAITAAGEGRLVGILTNRDVRFATNPKQRVAELMTKEKLITVTESVDMEEAKRLLHTHRIEKLLVVDDDYRCIGLITVKDIEKARLHPNACKDEQGRLRVAAATSVGDDGLARAERLIDAGADLIVVDTAHGHSQLVLDAVGRIKRQSNAVQVLAGNVATADGTKALIDAGADAVKVGIGPGSICTTRIVAGRRRAAIHRAARGGRGGEEKRHPGDLRRRHQIFRRSCQGARRRRRLRDARLAAGRHRREPGRGLFCIKAARTKPIAAWARSAPWRAARPTATSNRRSRTRSSSCPKASKARCPIRGRSRSVLHQLIGGLRASMGYTGARTLAEFHERAEFIRISTASFRESHVHDVTITRESPNYPREG